jgi:carboxymethylenebutenolidase
VFSIVKRIFLTAGIIIIALIALLAASIFIDGLAGRGRVEAVTNTTIPGYSGSPDLRAYVARPPSGSGPFPTVIMIHEFYGLNESIVGKAQGLAEEGYLVIAPDTFRGSTTAWIPRAIFQVITNNPAQVNQDLDAVYQWLAGQPDVDKERIAALGFCYGGRASLSYSLHNNGLAATVIFYGSPVTDPQVLQGLSGPVLGIFGGADNSIPLEEVRTFETNLQQAGIPHEISIYEGQPHAFVTNMEAIRAGGAQGEAWAQMVAFLDKYLRQSSGAYHPGTASAFHAPFDWRYYLAIALEHASGAPGHSH